MLCLQGATVLYGCVLLYTSFYKFALHKLSVVRTVVHALGRRPDLGADLSFLGVDLCLAVLKAMQSSPVHSTWKVTQAVWHSCLVELSRQNG